MSNRPNIVLLVSDQERQRNWIPPELDSLLPARRRLRERGMELTNHYTHSSPCSPSRATLLTGQYVPEHGVTDNVFHEPQQPDLHTGTPTIGQLLRGAGYRTAYLGKWHLSYGNPDMEAYGFSDWTGDDWAWTGLAGTGTHYDSIIAEQAAAWLRSAGDSPEPWLLVVGLLNPHDIVWYPADQPTYQATHPDLTDFYNRLLPSPIPGSPSIPAFTDDYEELFDLPANFRDDLNGKPAVQLQWQWEENHCQFGLLEHEDEQTWRRALDYYWKLHLISDAEIAKIFTALDDIDGWDDTVVMFTSDHGEMCGSHGMRGKGPFAYEEIMHVPLYVSAPGLTAPGSTSDALTSSADLASTICSLAGLAEPASCSGVDLSPLLAGEVAAVRDHVLFAQAQGWHKSCLAVRYSLRGYFDGRYKYVRYFGVGGGTDNFGEGLDWQPEMRFGPDAHFLDQEHELYDLLEDPGELVNLAADPHNSAQVREHFEHLLELESAAFTHQRPPGPGGGSTGASSMFEHALEELGEA